MFVAGGPDRNLHVLTEGGEKIHEALDGEGARPVAHQGGDAGLLDAEDLPGLRLGEATRLDEAVNLEREARFQEFLFRMGKPEIGENVPTALFELDRLFRSGDHFSSAFLGGDVRPQPSDGE